MNICIEYSVINKYSIYDIKYYFSKNKKIYLFFLFFLFLGVIAGIIISVSSDSYLTLLTSKDKVLFDYVNGKADFGKQSMKIMFSFLVFQIIVFLLSLNFYSGLISFLLVSYQGSLFYLSLSAVILKYGFSGVLTTLFLILPVNIILIGMNILFAGFCFIRSYNSLKQKRFLVGFGKEFWLMILLFFILEILFSYLISFVFMIVLKRRFFIIF